MIDTIKNEILELQVKRLGAELTSIKSIAGGLEYLWQGDEKYWGGQSYNLFPLIGGVPEDTYKLSGHTYNIKSHGFARDSEFELFSKAPNKLVYRLGYSEETLKRYPYEFELFVTYELEGNSIKHSYQVNNLGNEEMLFSVGAHPGFNCPLLKNENMEDYALVFEAEETSYGRLKADGFLTGEKKIFLNNQREKQLSHSLFYDGPIILDGLKSNWVEIRNSKNNYVIRVEYEGFPYLGIWSSQNDGPFVCIEPWFGVDSTVGDAPDFDKKEGLQKLMPKKSFDCGYSIIFKN
ncbi:MAG TPA: aldose 1-epimerase family protein [Ruminiclostridium sp.]